MIIDMHVHIAEPVHTNGRRELPSFPWKTRSFSRPFYRLLTNLSFGRNEALTSDSGILLLEKWVQQSQAEKVVLLALDGAYDNSGTLCQDTTQMFVSNDHVLQASRSSPCFLFGASVHPYRKDAPGAIAEVASQGACLVKWIPSAQNIEPDSPLCFPFYEALAHYNIPLLTHTGVEHTLGRKKATYNDPERLIPALEMGVTVIGAHCGTRLFLHDRSYFNTWFSLAAKYERFYGDLGAFALMTRIPYLKKILADKVVRAKVLYGSDFPSIPLPLWCWQLGRKKMRELSAITNPIERNIQVLQALDVPTEIFEKASTVLPVKNEKEK